MKKKPIQILLVALAQLLNPPINILINSLYFHVSAKVILQSAWYGTTWLERVSFFALGPLSAFSIYMVKRWSYPLFLLCVAFTAGQNIMVWRAHPQEISLGVLVALCATNILLVTYFLLPQVRKAYLDSSIRWWENKPRFMYSTAAKVTAAGVETKGHVLDVSEGGVFLQLSHKLTAGDTISLQLEDLGFSSKIESKVVYERTQGVPGYGVQFQHTKATSKQAREMVKAFKKQGVQSTIEKRHFLIETRDLVVGIFKTGRGWVPQPSPKMPRNTATAKSDSRAA